MGRTIFNPAARGFDPKRAAFQCWIFKHIKIFWKLFGNQLQVVRVQPQDFVIISAGQHRGCASDPRGQCGRVQRQRSKTGFAQRSNRGGQLLPQLFGLIAIQLGQGQGDPGAGSSFCRRFSIRSLSRLTKPGFIPLCPSLGEWIAWLHDRARCAAEPGIRPKASTLTKACQG